MTQNDPQSTAVEKIGIVIPTYLEGGNIASLITAILKTLADVEIIVVDDSPNSETSDAVRALKLKNVSVIHRLQKGGRGSAVIEGVAKLASFKCRWIIEMDADFSHPPAQIPQLLRQAREQKLDLLIGSRYLRESKIINWPLSRRAFSKASNLLARTLLEVPISDYTNGYRVYSDKAADVIAASCGKLGKGFIALSEILVNIYYRGLKVGEQPTIFTNRLRGESSVNAHEITNAFLGLFKILKLKWQLRRVENV